MSAPEKSKKAEAQTSDVKSNVKTLPVSKKSSKKATSKKPKVAAKKAAPKAKVKPTSTKRKTVKAKAAPKKVSAKPETTFNFMEVMMTAKPYDFEKLSKDATDGGKELYDAMQKSMNIWAKGLEALNKETFALTQDLVEKNQEAFKSLIACKDINEFTDVQNKLAQKQFDTLVNNTTKLSEITVKLATDSFAPINDQVNKAVKKATEAVAA